MLPILTIEPEFFSSSFSKFLLKRIGAIIFISKDDFNEEVDFLGASVNVGFGSASAFTLTKNNERVVELLSDALINPLLTEKEFEKEKEKLIESLKADRNLLMQFQEESVVHSLMEKIMFMVSLSLKKV